MPKFPLSVLECILIPLYKISTLGNKVYSDKYIYLFIWILSECLASGCQMLRLFGGASRKVISVRLGFRRTTVRRTPFWAPPAGYPPETNVHITLWWFADRCPQGLALCLTHSRHLKLFPQRPCSVMILSPASSPFVSYLFLLSFQNAQSAPP